MSDYEDARQALGDFKTRRILDAVERLTEEGEEVLPSAVATETRLDFLDVFYRLSELWQRGEVEYLSGVGYRRTWL